MVYKHYAQIPLAEIKSVHVMLPILRVELENGSIIKFAVLDLSDALRFHEDWKQMQNKRRK